MTNYHPLLRANKGQAPTAGQFNRLAENLEKVNTNKGPRFATARKSGDQAITSVLATEHVVTFDTEIVDTNNIFAASTFTIPSDAEVFRVTANIYLDSYYSYGLHLVFGFSGDLIIASGVGNYFLNTDTDGVRALNLDTGWIAYSGQTIQVAIISPTGNTFTVKSDNQTWMCVEVL